MTIHWKLKVKFRKGPMKEGEWTSDDVLSGPKGISLAFLQNEIPEAIDLEITECEVTE